ncbi:MAG: Cd(II)/Pb(II)-responsive transcriptional regulator [Brachymonas sp.]|nr:Cd(II)/Pb(II)-responsive transcriptional regulator [Brachymonas sp.]
MKIGELAAASGTSVETIRYYEREGLLPAPARTASNYRQYAHTHLERLAFIRHCRALDMSLGDIRQLIDLMANPLSDGAEVDALVQAQLARVQSRLRSLQALEKQLRTLQSRCMAHGEGQHLSGECPVLQELVVAARGESCVCHEQAACPPLGDPLGDE